MRVLLDVIHHLLSQVILVHHYILQVKMNIYTFLNVVGEVKMGIIEQIPILFIR